MICYLVQYFTLTSLFRKKILACFMLQAPGLKQIHAKLSWMLLLELVSLSKCRKKICTKFCSENTTWIFLITILQGFFLIQELLRHLFYTYMEDNSAMYNVCRMKDRVTRPWFCWFSSTGRVNRNVRNIMLTLTTSWKENVI